MRYGDLQILIFTGMLWLLTGAGAAAAQSEPATATTAAISPAAAEAAQSASDLSGTATPDTTTDTTTDECFASLAVGNEAAERACSDTIASLSYLTTPTPSDNQALVSGYNNRGIARTRAGDLEGAAADFGEALIRSPDNWAIYLNRGNLQLARNEPAAALLDYQRAAELAPRIRSASARNASLAYRQQRDLGRAIQALTQSAAGAGLSAADSSTQVQDSEIPDRELPDSGS